MKKGDAVVFDYRIEHRGRANTVPDTDRPLLYLSFAKRWYRDPRNHIDLDEFPSLFPKEVTPPCENKICDDDNSTENENCSKKVSKICNVLEQKKNKMAKGQ